MRSAWSIAAGAGAAFGLLVCLLGGCGTSHYAINPALTHHSAGEGYRIQNLQSRGNSDSLYVSLAMSGGGHRAAALAYGVFEALRDTPIVWEGRSGRLLDELDFVSSVSGSSLTAAYYALHGDGLFQRFIPDVLDEDIQREVIARSLSPRGLWRTSSPRFGRGDILQEVLDERIFRGASFADFRRMRPMTNIAATEISYGERFDFSQDQFDQLCSDLDGVPVARAVAASMAVPIAFSPITLWNHTNDCPVQMSLPPSGARISGREFVHLLDGGLADNLGARSPLEMIGAAGGIIGAARFSQLHGVRKMVFILVNAQVTPDFDEDRSADVPGLFRQLRAAVEIPIDRYTATSMEAIRSQVTVWRNELRNAPQSALGDFIARDTEFYLIEVSVDNADPDERAALRTIPTALRILPDDRDRLRDFAGRQLRADPEFRRLLRDLADGK